MIAARNRLIWLSTLMMAISNSPALADPVATDALSVKAEVVPTGTRFVGQAFELRVSVNAADRRPEIELPRMRDAETAVVSTTFRPLSVSEIGAFTSRQNRFITRVRVVPRRVGTLEIPPVRATMGGRSGKSQPVRVTILPVPPDGRPPEFLGGIGNFSLTCQVSQNAARVGQELEFRITVSGPAAVGMVDRPNLVRFDQLPIAPTIQPLTNDTTIEPPGRTFRYRIRPTKPGNVVLPPVMIAAFEPVSQHYVSRVTQGIPLQVVAVPAFDPSAIKLNAIHSRSRQLNAQWAVIAICAIVLFLALTLYRAVRRFRAWRTRVSISARQFALEFARELESPMTSSAIASKCDFAALAERVTNGLIRYLELATDRPPGAITPNEAELSIDRLTGSNTLGNHTKHLISTCDTYRFGHSPSVQDDDIRIMIESARSLFQTLSRRRFESMRRRDGLLKFADDSINDPLSRVTETPRC